jgi:predicted O-methyltransferase YrrM
MSLSTKIKDGVNLVLGKAGMRLETLTAERAEAARLSRLKARDYFAQPVFPVIGDGGDALINRVLAAQPEYRERFDSFRRAGDNDAGFSYDNTYYSSPDADVLYTLTRLLQPRRIIEVGSGNSTRLFRQAIRDGSLDARLISIDPCPRSEVASIADEVHRHAVEEMDSQGLFSTLEAGDILFIDSSHEVRTGNDCVFLFLRVLPSLRPGVIVHVHDVYLPYDYPDDRPETRPWAEQYLLQAFLAGRPGVEVIWPSHHLFRSRPELLKHFPQANGDTHHTCAFWFRINHV